LLHSLRGTIGSSSSSVAHYCRLLNSSSGAPLLEGSYRRTLKSGLRGRLRTFKRTTCKPSIDCIRRLRALQHLHLGKLSRHLSACATLAGPAWRKSGISNPKLPWGVAALQRCHVAPDPKPRTNPADSTAERPLLHLACPAMKLHKASAGGSMAALVPVLAIPQYAPH